MIVDEHARLDTLSILTAQYFIDTKLPGFKSVAIQMTDSTRDLGTIVIQGSKQRVEIKDVSLCCPYHLMKDIEMYTFSKIIEGFLKLLDKKNDN